MSSKAQLFLEGWRDAEKFQREFALRNDPIGHHYNKILSQHIDMANGKDRRFKGRAKEILRHFIRWQEAEREHKEKHKKFPTMGEPRSTMIFMDDLADQKPAALQAWRHYKRHVEPKERQYHKATWLLNQETELAGRIKTHRGRTI